MRGERPEALAFLWCIFNFDCNALRRAQYIGDAAICFNGRYLVHFPSWPVFADGAIPTQIDVRARLDLDASKLSARRMNWKKKT